MAVPTIDPGKIASVLLLGLLTTLATPAWAMTSGELLSGLQGRYQKTSAWQAHFIQTTYVALIEDTVTKNGTIKVKKPGKLHIAYQGERGRIYLSNGKRLWIYERGDTQVVVYKKTIKWFAKEALSFLNGLGDLQKDFDLVGLEQFRGVDLLIRDKQLDLLHLKPRNAASPVEAIVLGIEKTSFIVKELTLINQSGNTTHYQFAGVELNQDLPDEDFEFQKTTVMVEVEGD